MTRNEMFYAMRLVETTKEPSPVIDKLLWQSAGMVWRDEKVNKQSSEKITFAFWPGEKDPTLDIWNSPSRQVDAMLSIIQRTLPHMVPLIYGNRAMLIPLDKSSSDWFDQLKRKPVCAGPALALAHAWLEVLLTPPAKPEAPAPLLPDPPIKSGDMVAA